MSKKILFLIPNLMHGGAEKVLVNLVNNMNRDKYDITIMTLFDVGVNKKYLKEDIGYRTLFKHQFRGNNTLLKLFSPQFLYKKIIKNDYDIVVSYLEGATTRIISGCNNPNTKKIAWLHIELNTPKTASLGFRTSKEAIKYYDKIDRIIAVSKDVKECFLDNLDVNTPVDILYNTNETNVILEKSKEGVEDVIFNAEEVNICSVAKLVKTKGYDRLARIHKRLIEEGIKHHIYILGIGEQKNEIQKYLEKNKLTDTFSFIGFRNNPYKYIAKCDLYVCSSLREGFSTAVTESLVVGTPVISTNCSGSKELLGENNEYGLVVENSEEALYIGLKKMIVDKKLRDYYKKQCNIRAQKFSKDTTVKEVETMLGTIMGDELNGEK